MREGGRRIAWLAWVVGGATPFHDWKVTMILQRTPLRVFASSREKGGERSEE